MNINNISSYGIGIACYHSSNTLVSAHFVMSCTSSISLFSSPDVIFPFRCFNFPGVKSRFFPFPLLTAFGRNLITCHILPSKIILHFISLPSLTRLDLRSHIQAKLIVTPPAYSPETDCLTGWQSLASVIKPF